MVSRVRNLFNNDIIGYYYWILIDILYSRAKSQSLAETKCETMLNLWERAYVR